MTVWAITMVRDEADVIGATLRHIAQEGVEGIIVADNGSVDGTRDILTDLKAILGCALVIIDDPEVAYYQSAKMSALAERAGTRHKAEWIIPFDADEIWVSHIDQIAKVLRFCVPAESMVFGAALFNHYATAIDPPGDEPFRTMVWRDRAPLPLPKVAFRWVPGAVIHQGNHGVSLPIAHRTDRFDAGLEVRHFPYRSPAQFVRKARNGAQAYRATELPHDQGAHWRAYGDLLDAHGPEVLEEVFRTYFWKLSPTDEGLLYDPAPYLRFER